VKDQTKSYPLEDRLRDLEKSMKRCKRTDGSYRAAFETREQAEAFAADPQNWPMYQGDLAHHCRLCSWWHLSKASWLGISVN